MKSSTRLKLKLIKTKLQPKNVSKNKGFPITLVYEEFERTAEGEAFFKANPDHPDAKFFYQAN